MELQKCLNRWPVVGLHLIWVQIYVSKSPTHTAVVVLVFCATEYLMMSCKCGRVNILSNVSDCLNFKL